MQKWNKCQFVNIFSLGFKIIIQIFCINRCFIKINAFLRKFYNNKVARVIVTFYMVLEVKKCSKIKLNRERSLHIYTY